MEEGGCGLAEGGGVNLYRSIYHPVVGRWRKRRRSAPACYPSPLMEETVIRGIGEPQGELGEGVISQPAL